MYVVPPISTNFYGKSSFRHAAPELYGTASQMILNMHAGTIKSYLFKSNEVCVRKLPVQHSIVFSHFLPIS